MDSETSDTDNLPDPNYEVKGEPVDSETSDTDNLTESNFKLK